MMTAADCLLSEENTHKNIFFTYLIHNKGRKTILVSIWIKFAARGRRIKNQNWNFEFYVEKKTCQKERVLNVNKVSRIFSWNCHIFYVKKISSNWKDCCFHLQNKCKQTFTNYLMIFLIIFLSFKENFLRKENRQIKSSFARWM